MGQFSSQLYFPPLSKINKIIIGTTVTLFVVSALLKLVAGIDLSLVFGLFPPSFFKGFFFQLITYPFMHEQLLDFIFNCLIVWWIGSELEYILGKAKYIGLICSVVIGTGIFYLILTYFFIQLFIPVQLYGLTGLNYAFLLFYAMIYPDRPMLLMGIFPLKAKYFCLVLGFMQLYLSIFSSNRIIPFTHLFSVVCALCFVFIVDPSLLPSAFRLKFNFKRAPKKKNHLKIVKEDSLRNDKNGPNYWH